MTRDLVVGREGAAPEWSDGRFLDWVPCSMKLVAWWEGALVPTTTRVPLTRLPGGRVRVHGAGEPDGTGTGADLDLALDDLPAYVAGREAEAARTGRPVRWVWDDTARWYPPLLATGVRVARCHDLRLARQVLRRAPAADPRLLAGEQADRWDALAPAVAEPDTPALFAADDAGLPLRADLEEARQQAVVAASAEPGALTLLLAAESVAALAAAEMTHAGLPWRSDVHDRLLTEALGPRPPRGSRPVRLEAVADEVRALLGAPGLNPDSRPDLLAALRRAGLEAADTRAWTLRRLDHPVVEPLLRYKQLVHLFTTTGWAWREAWVRDGRFRPAYVPAGSATGRWASHGGGALSFPAQVRPAAVADEGWLLVVADVAQLEPRVLAGMSGDRALAAAARGADLYQAMVDDGSVARREDAKLGLLGALYGATTGGSGLLLGGLKARYPDAFGLVDAAARDGEQGRVVRTLLGRGAPSLELPEHGETDGQGVREADRERARAWGRFTRNFVVQGTAAEWAACWLGELRGRLWQLRDDPAARLEEGPHLVFFLHDEVVVHTPAAQADAVVAAVRDAATAAGRLLLGDVVDLPLGVSVVRAYADASKATTVGEGGEGMALRAEVGEDDS